MPMDNEIKIVNGEVPWAEIAKRTDIEGPHAWIQWKGTDVCADIHCACGVHSHLDAGFAYFVRCPGCKQVYAMGPSVPLVPLSEGPSEGCAVRDASDFDDAGGEEPPPG